MRFAFVAGTVCLLAGCAPHPTPGVRAPVEEPSHTTNTARPPNENGEAKPNTGRATGSPRLNPPPPETHAARAMCSASDRPGNDSASNDRLTPDCATAAPGNLGTKEFEVGRARFRLGELPPWAAQQVVKAPGPRSTRWRLKRTFWVGEGYLYQAAFTADGDSLLTLSNRTGRIHRYTLTGKRFKKILLPDFEEFSDASFIPIGGQQLLLTRPSGSSIVHLSTSNFEPYNAAAGGTDLRRARVPDLYGVTSRSTAPQSGKLTLQWQGGIIALQVVCRERPDDWAISHDGTLLALSYYPSDVVEVVDLRARTLVSQIGLPKFGGSIDISPNGKRIALGGEKLVLASFPSGEVLAEDARYGNNIHNVRFSHEGDLLLTSAYDGKARSYIIPPDLGTSKNLPRPQELPHSGRANVYGIGFNADGSKLVTSSGDRTLKLWVR